MINKIKSALFGLAVGDALGVPVEFKGRDYLERFPVQTMTGYGSWNQPPGTWSDDSSLAFCLAESLTEGYNLDDIAANFVKWMQQGYWGAHHKVFDIGGATRFAIGRLTKGISPKLSGGMMEDDNGNGSLMRILPLFFSLQNLSISERYQKVKEVSSITHAHFRSVFACFIYIEIATRILQNETMNSALINTQKAVNTFAAENDFNPRELLLFKRILQEDLAAIKEPSIFSSGYVLHTLEASLWCLLNTDNYAAAVLKAVNLGGDTDTTGCVTGGLAGLLYGYEAVPNTWINTLARNNDIEDLSIRLCKKIEQQ